MSSTLTYCKYVNLYSERWCMSVKWSGCSNLNRWDLFYRTLCMLHDEDKLSIQWPCSGDFRRFARVFLFVVNTLTVTLSFCYIFKDFVGQLKVHCEQSLFFFRFSESNARARERRSRETRETRAAASPVSRHQSRAWPLRVSRFARRTTEKKRDCS